MPADDRPRNCSTATNAYNQAATSVGGNVAKSIKGHFETKGQYHYHMETQCAVAIPDEHGLIVYSSTQFMDSVHHAIAACLNVAANTISMQLPRVGGAYGAKITRGHQIACAAALGAHCTARPVRFTMSMEANMQTIGKRNGVDSRYRIDVDDTGKIQKLLNNFVGDNGCSSNESPHVIAGLSFNNGYDTTTWTVNGSSALTYSPSNTLCRAPGTLEGIAMIETIMEHIAFETNRDGASVRLANMPAGSPLSVMLKDFLKAIGRFFWYRNVPKVSNRF